MKIVETQMTLVALTLDEIETISSGLEISFHECKDMKAGALFSQFNDLRDSLKRERNQVI